MKEKIIITISGILVSASLITAIPTLAQTATGEKIRLSSTTRQINIEARIASRTADRVVNLQDRGNKEIDTRTNSLNGLLGRVQEMKKVSNTQKSAISNEVQNEINTLTNLKAKIGSDTSTTSLKADDQSITKAYRVYALIMPRLNISAAADRINTVADMLSTIVGKLQARLASTSNSITQAKLDEMTAKIADARTQAQAALTETASLQPDNGVQTVMQSNTSALKDARTKIQAAQKDLIAARQDAKSVIEMLGKNKKTTASSTQQ